MRLVTGCILALLLGGCAASIGSVLRRPPDLVRTYPGQAASLAQCTLGSLRDGDDLYSYRIMDQIQTDGISILASRTSDFLTRRYVTGMIVSFIQEGPSVVRVDIRQGPDDGPRLGARAVTLIQECAKRGAGPA